METKTSLLASLIALAAGVAGCATPDAAEESADAPAPMTDDPTSPACPETGSGDNVTGVGGSGIASGNATDVGGAASNDTTMPGMGDCEMATMDDTSNGASTPTYG